MPFQLLLHLIPNFQLSLTKVLKIFFKMNANYNNNSN